MASAALSPESLNALHNKATQLRIESVRATSEAASGHPSSCCSAADIVATLFFSVMRYDPKNPKAPNSDRFVLSKDMPPPCFTRPGRKQDCSQERPFKVADIGI